MRVDVTGRLIRAVMGTFFFGLALAAVRLSAAEPPQPRPYDGLTAGDEAYRAGEAERRRDIARQLDHVDQLKWYAGLPNRSNGVVLYRDPPSLDFIYATGRWSRLGPNGQAVRFGQPDIFEPWPIVPGDIYGWPDVDTVDQPVGHESIQTGPNRWEYHPLYARDFKPVPAVRPTAPLLIPPPPLPGDEIPSKPSGLQEF